MPCMYTFFFVKKEQKLLPRLDKMDVLRRLVKMEACGKRGRYVEEDKR